MKKNFPIKALITYLDDMFEDTTYYSKRRVESANEWKGFFRNSDDEILLGQPLDEPEDSSWFCHGPIFENATFLFNISWAEFYLLLKDYINQRFPELNIRKVF